MRTAYGTSIAKNLEEGEFLKYSVPQYLICDNGTQFTSNIFRALAERLNFKILYNAKYHPQNNPTVRTNSTLKTRIRSYLTDDHRRWDEKLAHLIRSINTARHEVTTITPHFFNFYREHTGSRREYGPAPSNTYPR